MAKSGSVAVTSVASVTSAASAASAGGSAGASAIARPAVTGVSPAAGLPGGGVTVTVTGSGFLKVTKVTFGTVAGTKLRVLSAGKLTVVAPRHPAGAVDVRVYGAYGTSAAVARDHFRYLAPPAVPFTESAGATGLGVVVAWAPPAASDYVRSFAVTAAPAPGSPASCPAKTVTAPASDSQALVAGLCAGVVYRATVKARNAVAFSKASPASAPVVPLAAQPPGVPLITSVLARNGSLVVSWVPPADDGGRPVTGYAITASGGSKTVTVHAAPAARSATVTGLVNGTAYAVLLTASNAAGTSHAASGSGTPAATHAPTAPGALSAVPDGKGRLVASWSPPADNGGAAVTGYTLSYRRAALNSGTGKWAPVSGATVHRIHVAGTATTATAASFETRKAYYLFSVTASNKAGTSAAATQGAAVTPALTIGPRVTVLSPATVAALSVVSGTALAWSDPAPVQAARLTAGQTIVAAPGGLLPQGTFRQVVSVSDKGGTLTVATRQGQLATALPSLGVDAALNPLTGAAGSSVVRSTAMAAPRFVPTMAGVRVIPSNPRDSVGFGQSVSLSLNISAGAVAVEAEVSLDASIDVSIGVHHGFAGIPNGVTLTATAQVKAEVSGRFQVSGSLYKKIGEIDGEPVDIQVGFVPIIFVPKVPVFLKITGTVGIGISATQVIGGSLSWSSQHPGTLVTHNISTGPKLTVDPYPAATGDLELTLTTQPQADVYDAAGPNIEEDNALAVHMDPTGHPFLSAGPEIALKAGLDIPYEVFGEYPHVEATIGTFKFASYDIDSAPTASYAISPANPVVAADGSLALTAVRSDGGTAPLTWGLLGGTSADSISSAGALHASEPAGRTLTVTVSDPSGATGQVSVTVGTPFDPPPTLTATRHPHDTGALVTWTAPAQTGGSPLAGYTVVTEPSTGTHAVGAATTSLTLPPLAPGSYLVEVYATNTAGMVSVPATVGLSIVIPPPPVAPGTWTASQAPVPPGGNSPEPDAVSCWQPSHCVAVGAYADTSNGAHGLLLTGAGGSWTAAKGPLPAGATDPGSYLTGVSCLSSAVCVAVGGYTDKSRHGYGWLLTRSGTSWTPARAPLPANAEAGPFSSLAGVSCPSPSACVAVGFYRDKRGAGEGLILTRSGATWTPTQAPLPASAASDPSVQLTAVSCPSPATCVAVGDYSDKSGNDNAGMVLVRSGGRWTAAELPLPPKATGTELTGVSCSTAASCVAVGVYWDDRAGGHGLLLTLSGGAWKAAQAPVPPNAGTFTNAWAFGASCSSPQSCVAVGFFPDNFTHDFSGMLLTWSNGSWKTAQTPLPANGVYAVDTGESSLYAVSCTSPATCTAVGTYGATTGTAGLILTSSA
jgi:hypothetical protein